MQTCVLSILGLLVTTVIADLNCTRWVAQGFKESIGRISFYGQTGYVDVYPSFAQAKNPMVLVDEDEDATVFYFQTCNSTSLRKNRFVFDHPFLGCNVEGCQAYHFDFVRIIVPSSGYCLTSTVIPNYLGARKLVPQRCDPQPTNGSQLFLITQRVMTPWEVLAEKTYDSPILYPGDALGPTPNDIDPSRYAFPLAPYSSWFVWFGDADTYLFHYVYDGTENTLYGEIEF